MSVGGLSNLIVTIMAAGEVGALPVREQRRLHEALAVLDAAASSEADRVWQRFGGRRTWRPDPGAGRRADGVTHALWEAVSAAWISVVEDDNGAHYVLEDAGRQVGRRQIMRLPAPEATLLYGVGAAWAAASTSRKKPASALASSA